MADTLRRINGNELRLGKDQPAQLPGEHAGGVHSPGKTKRAEDDSGTLLQGPLALWSLGCSFSSQPFHAHALTLHLSRLTLGQ